MPFDGYYVFVDLMPKANWGHPAFSLLISSDGNKTQLFHTEFPPHLDDYPETYRELMLE
ncbi:hypothetical protein LPW11_18200 [Geomonas sp. RF6]|uniref:hypothetical protein n=1 Tax=Geomonas sp. RF6 TaxID=2897342 RepID=UPI001E600C2A|nr:hypothetical protein [Geomonas sp. RF6]UFS69808.1 hypothetical protein LPW11_18200 [Geomonas sp. RF6]